MPTHEKYLENGVPIYWRELVTGAVRGAMMAFVAHRQDSRNREPSADELARVQEYLRYFTEAPCWDHPADGVRERDILSELRKQIASEAMSFEELWDFYHSCLSIGIEPI